MRLTKDFGVRALLATLAVGAAVIAGLYLVIFTTEKQMGYDFLKSAALIALGFYFGQSKPTTDTTNTTTPPKTPTQ
jgi:hypothetical protein